MLLKLIIRQHTESSIIELSLYETNLWGQRTLHSSQSNSNPALGNTRKPASTIFKQDSK